MLLAIDVGNTNTNFAVINNGEFLAFFAMTTKLPRTSDEFSAAIREQLMIKDLPIDGIDGCIVSSVVPAIMHSLVNGIIKLTGIRPMEVGAGTKTGIKIRLANAKEAGADRIVDLAAAYSIYGGNTMVIDFGTATTYDLVEKDGSFRYGITCPGIRISANALWSDTAKLPEIEIKLPDTILANDTVSSMQAGLLYGCIGQTEYIIKRVKEEAGLKEMKVVATGGLGGIISQATSMIDEYDRRLTMKGLEIIYNKNIR
ncbi:MAG: type III pantothenate kinase [Lachnospiraceae bacterium]|nr:type III pantothenate kinase [Lachnospiraceae bacterium]